MPGLGMSNVLTDSTVANQNQLNLANFANSNPKLNQCRLPQNKIKFNLSKSFKQSPTHLFVTSAQSKKQQTSICDKSS